MGPAAACSMPQSAAALRWLTTAPVAEREHGRHAAAFEAEAGVPDCVHTAMKAVQAAGLDAAGDCVLSPMPGGRELRRAHDAVLPRGDPGDQSVAIGAFLAHTGE